MLLPSPHFALPLLSIVLLAGSSSAGLFVKSTLSSSPSIASLRNSDQWSEPLEYFHNLVKNSSGDRKGKRSFSRVDCAGLLNIFRALPHVTARDEPYVIDNLKIRTSAVKLRNHLQKVLSQEVRSLCEALPDLDSHFRGTEDILGANLNIKRKSSDVPRWQDKENYRKTFATHISHVILLVNTPRAFPVEGFKEIFQLAFWRSITSLLQLSLSMKVEEEDSNSNSDSDSVDGKSKSLLRKALRASAKNMIPKMTEAEQLGNKLHGRRSSMVLSPFAGYDDSFSSPTSFTGEKKNKVGVKAVKKHLKDYENDVKAVNKHLAAMANSLKRESTMASTFHHLTLYFTYNMVNSMLQEGGLEGKYKEQFALYYTNWRRKEVAVDPPLPARVLDAITGVDDEYDSEMFRAMSESLELYQKDERLFTHTSWPAFLRYMPF